MAENPIRKEDIIDSESVEKSLENIAKILTTIIGLMANIKAEGKEMSAALVNINPAKPEDQKAIADITEKTNDLKKAKDGLNKAEKELLKLQEKLLQVNTAEFREELRLKEAINSKTKAIRDNIRAEGAEEGSLIKLKQRLSELRQEYDKAGAAGRDKFVKEINKVTSEITRAEKAIGVHSRGVGSYKESIIAAGKQLAGFLGIAGGGVAILNKLKTTFAEMETGEKFFGRLKESSKTFFQSLITYGNMGMAIDQAKETFQIAKQASEIRRGDRTDLKVIAQLETDIALLRLEASKVGLSDAQTLKLINEASKKENELIEFKIADKEEELKYTKELLSIRIDDTKLMDQAAQLEADIISLRGEKSLRIAREKATLEEKIAKDMERQAAAAAESARLQMFGASMIDAKRAETANLTAKIEFEAGQQKLIQNKEYWDKNSKMVEEANQHELIRARQVQEAKEAIYIESFALLGSLQSSLSAKYEKEKEREILAAKGNKEKIAEIEKAYAKKQKNLAIIMATISTAEGVARALYDYSFPYNIIVGAIVAAAGAAEISTINSQQFAEGGDIKGKSHRNGGVQVEAEGGEYIINKRATSKYHDLIEAINKDNPMQIAEELRNRQFHTVWGGVKADLSAIQKQDPYTKMIYELMKNDVKVYTDSNGDTVLRWPDGSSRIVRKYQS